MAGVEATGGVRRQSYFTDDDIAYLETKDIQKNFSISQRLKFVCDV